MSKKLIGLLLLLIPLGKCQTELPRTFKTNISRGCIKLYSDGSHQYLQLKEKTYKTSLTLYNIYLEKKHLLREDYVQALENPSTLEKTLEIIDLNSDGTITFQEALKVYLSSDNCAQLENMIKK